MKLKIVALLLLTSVGASQLYGSEVDLRIGASGNNSGKISPSLMQQQGGDLPSTLSGSSSISSLEDKINNSDNDNNNNNHERGEEDFNNNGSFQDDFNFQCNNTTVPANQEEQDFLTKQNDLVEKIAQRVFELKSGSTVHSTSEENFEIRELEKHSYYHTYIQNGGEPKFENLVNARIKDKRKTHQQHHQQQRQQQQLQHHQQQQQSRLELEHDKDENASGWVLASLTASLGNMLTFSKSKEDSTRTMQQGMDKEDQSNGEDNRFDRNKSGEKKSDSSKSFFAGLGYSLKNMLTFSKSEESDSNEQNKL